MNLVDAYNSLIVWIGDGSGASDSLLHVHAGMAVLLLARLITGRSLATPLPFAAVCLAEIGNEVMDRLHNGTWLWGDTALDVLNTLFWPFVLMVGLRLRRAREGRRWAFVKIPNPTTKRFLSDQISGLTSRNAQFPQPRDCDRG